jgi:hypothetical protein
MICSKIILLQNKLQGTATQFTNFPLASHVKIQILNRVSTRTTNQ